MSRLTRDGTAEPVSRDQILRHARGQENINFPCSADHEQDWQPYPVDPYSAICDDHTYIHTYIVRSRIFFLFYVDSVVRNDWMAGKKEKNTHTCYILDLRRTRNSTTEKNQKLLRTGNSTTDAD